MQHFAPDVTSRQPEPARVANSCGTKTAKSLAQLTLSFVGAGSISFAFLRLGMMEGAGSSSESLRYSEYVAGGGGGGRQRPDTEKGLVSIRERRGFE